MVYTSTTIQPTAKLPHSVVMPVATGVPQEFNASQACIHSAPVDMSSGMNMDRKASHDYSTPELQETHAQ